MEIKNEINKFKDELITLRRDFHMYPELGFKEFRTQKIVEKYLKSCGLKVKRMTKTGVVALLEGDNSGQTLLMRADMDAIPIEEENDILYKSRNKGVMHACGHDGHMAMLLVAAKILSKYRGEINGNIKFVFQPNEEEAGAKYMVEDGVLENPKVDAAIGIHLWSPLEIGQISIDEGPVMGAHDNFKLTIKGKGGHTAMPHEAVDPVLIAAQIIIGAQSIQTKEINALSPTLINFSKINAGNASNVIPEVVTMEGTLRYLYEGGANSIERPRERLERVVAGICKTFNAEYEMEIIPSNFPVVNEKKMTNLVRTIALDLVGEENLVPYITMAGEDFSEFTIGIPSTFYFVGVGNKKKETNYPHHHPKFNIDEEALIIGTEMHIRTALKYLSGETND